MGLTLEKSKKEKDKVIEKEEIKFLIGADIQNYVPSVYIDYHRGIFGGGFRVFVGGQQADSCC